MPLDIRSEAVNQLAEALAARLAIASPDYARWLPILRNQLKDMNFSRIGHFSHFPQQMT